MFVRLDGAGESFLNQDIIKIIHYIHGQGIGTAVSTNFLNSDENEIEKLIKAGLDYLIVSIDGTTQDVYEKYRVGGSLEKALENLKIIIRKKMEMNTVHPFVEWQFLIFDHNRHEIPQLIRMAKEIGVDRLLTSDCDGNANQVRMGKEIGVDRQLASDCDGNANHVPNPRRSSYNRLLSKSAVNSCYWLYKVLNVGWNGDCKSCCTPGLADIYSIGNILNEELDELWNGKNYQLLRELFIRDQNEWKMIIESRCYGRCPLVYIYRKKNGLRIY